MTGWVQPAPRVQRARLARKACKVFRGTLALLALQVPPALKGCKVCRVMLVPLGPKAFREKLDPPGLKVFKAFRVSKVK